jgi:hypothetical protein
MLWQFAFLLHLALLLKTEWDKLHCYSTVSLGVIVYVSCWQGHNRVVGEWCGHPGQQSQRDGKSCILLYSLHKTWATSMHTNWFYFLSAVKSIFLHVWFKQHIDTQNVRMIQCNSLSRWIQHFSLGNLQALKWNCNACTTESLFVVFSDMNFTNCVLIHGCWNTEPVLCVKWIYLNITDLLWVAHIHFIVWLCYPVTCFSYSKGCHGRGREREIFL